jgi:hypothetical protein
LTDPGLPSSSQLRQPILNLCLRIGPLTLGTLKHLFGQVVIDEVVRKIDVVKSQGEVVDHLEIFVMATFTYEIVAEFTHSNSLRVAPISPPSWREIFSLFDVILQHLN